MSELKCPFCQQELDYLAEDIYCCPNHQKYMGSEELWQELIRTRKALDKALHYLDAEYHAYIMVHKKEPEQKDIK